MVLALHGALWLSAMLGGGVLLVAFVLLLVMVLPGLWQAATQRLLRWGIGSALLAALVTALLGFALAVGLSGKATLALPALTDLHASWGVLGWVLGLLAAVSRVGADVPRRAVGTYAPAGRLASAAVWYCCSLLLGLAGGALPGRMVVGKQVGICV